MRSKQEAKRHFTKLWIADRTLEQLIDIRTEIDNYYSSFYFA